MSSATANMLTEGQVVQLDLGGKTTALPCRVLGFGGSTVMLAPVVPATAPTTEAIEAGREAYVILDAEHQVHALRARVRPGSVPGEVVVSVTDTFRLGQRRQYSRAPLALAAQVTGAGETWSAVTRDISPGGVRMARVGAAGEQADTLSIVLESPPAGLRIQAQAGVVRRSQRDLALHFTEISEGDVALLTQITVAYYRLAR